MTVTVQRQLLLDLSTLHSSKVCTNVTSLNLSVTFVHKCTHHVQPRIRPWMQKWTPWSSAYNRHKYTNEVYINIYTIVLWTRDLNSDMYEYDIVSEYIIYISTGRHYLLNIHLKFFNPLYRAKSRFRSGSMFRFRFACCACPRKCDQ